MKRIKVTTALWVSPSQVFRQTVQLCRLRWSTPDPGAQRSSQKPRQLLEHLLYPEPPEIRRWQEVQHILGAGQWSVQLYTTYCLLNNMIGYYCAFTHLLYLSVADIDLQFRGTSTLLDGTFLLQNTTSGHFATFSATRGYDILQSEILHIIWITSS